MGNQTFVPRDYDVFAGLDVDRKSISVTFTDHQGAMKSMRMPYSVEHLVNHVRTSEGVESKLSILDLSRANIEKILVLQPFLPCWFVPRIFLLEAFDKAEGWSYEREWRLFTPGNAGRFVEFQSQELTGLILGCSTSRRSA